MVKTLEQLKTLRKARNTKQAGENKKMTNPNKFLNVSTTKKDFVRPNKTPKRTVLRSDIKVGQVLILLSGRFRGRRVVFLRQLASGLLLVTGPFKVNGVPLKRVNQAYVIATKTNVNVAAALPLVEKLAETDFFGAASDNKTVRKSFFEDSAEKSKRVSEDKKTLQKNVDTKVLEAVKATPLLKNYLANRFALKNGDRPHSMVY
jgi:large subunit ribosomal protein L6e